MASSHLPSPAQADADASTVSLADTGRAARVGLWALGLGFGGFLLWASLAPLDEGVPAQGTVMIDTKRKAVQHLSGGIIRQVLVHEGQQVQEGQPLIELDSATMRANYESVRQRYLSLRAMQGRLQAEQANRSALTFIRICRKRQLTLLFRYRCKRKASSCRRAVLRCVRHCRRSRKAFRASRPCCKPTMACSRNGAANSPWYRRS